MLKEWDMKVHSSGGVLPKIFGESICSVLDLKPFPVSDQINSQTTAFGTYTIGYNNQLNLRRIQLYINVN